MRDDPALRTTLDLDDDVLQAAKEMAEVAANHCRESAVGPGRKALGPPAANAYATVCRCAHASGDAPRPTMKLVNELRDEA